MRIALYPRVSTQEQALNGHSIDEQIERMNKYCEAMGWKVYKTYTDAGYSGANTNRPALQRMIKDIEAGKIDKVLVYKLDRLSRSQLDTLYLIEKVFLANNVDFVSMNENFDTSTPFGRAMIGILAVFAQLEREQIKERMMMGKEARAKKGLYHGSNCYPIGYDYINGHLVPLEFEAIQIKMIFEMYAEGKAPLTIAEYLNNNGYTTRYGRWNDITVRKILRRKTYLGYIKYHDDWYKGEHEALISEDLFNTVQKIFDQRTEDYSYYKRREGRVNSYLGGMLFCDCCGGKYSKIISNSTKNGKKYRNTYYKCNSRTFKKRTLVRDPNCKNKTWRMDVLDNLVFDEIKKLALDPDYINKIKTPQENYNKQSVIENQIENIKNQINKLMDLYTIGGMPVDLLQEKIHDLNDQQKKLETEIEKIEDEKKKKMTHADAMKMITSFKDVLERGDYAEIRTSLSALIEKIVIKGEDIEIYWRFV